MQRGCPAVTPQAATQPHGTPAVRKELQWAHKRSKVQVAKTWYKAALLSPPRPPPSRMGRLRCEYQGQHTHVGKIQVAKPYKSVVGGCPAVACQAPPSCISCAFTRMRRPSTYTSHWQQQTAIQVQPHSSLCAHQLSTVRPRSTSTRIQRPLHDSSSGNLPTTHHTLQLIPPGSPHIHCATV
jgi:hypothetical protein